MKGNHKKATDKYRKILLNTINKNTQNLGQGFGKWTAKKSATYLGINIGNKINEFTNSE